MKSRWWRLTAPYRGTLDVSIMVTEVNEGPEITGPATRTVAENFEDMVATYTGEDPEDTAADINRWSVTGRDGGDFTINEGGELTFRNPPDFERPADANRDNEYEVTVRASDGRHYGTYGRNRDRGGGKRSAGVQERQPDFIHPPGERHV